MQVQALVKIQSDDREAGIDDGTPIIEPGTFGILLGDSVAPNGQSFRTDEPLYMVDFGSITFDCTAKEIALV